MSAKQKAAQPGGLRLVHALLFFGFAAATVATSQLELMQLWKGLFHPFHTGTPPAVIPAASGVIAMLGAVVLLVRLVIGRPISWVLSIVMLLAAGGSFTVLLTESKQRTIAGANVQALEAAKLVRQQIETPLQDTGKVPENLTVPTVPSPFRRKGFAVMPWKLQTAKRTDALPDGAEPGWILLHTPDDRSSFSMTVVGVDADGEPAILRDEHGVAVEIKGAFNPDTAG